MRNYNALRKILSFEDEVIISLSIVALLNTNGFETIVALDDYEGVRLAEYVPGLITCNVNLPGLNGLDVLKELRLDPITADIPFIFISSETPQFEQEQPKTYSYLTKPFADEELIKLIDRLLRT